MKIIKELTRNDVKIIFLDAYYCLSSMENFNYKNKCLIVKTKNSKFYYKKSISSYKLHKETDKPAVIIKNYAISYWKNGKLHRETGPAVKYHDGHIDYYLNGKLIIIYVIIKKSMKFQLRK